MSGYNRLGPHGQAQNNDEQDPFQDPQYNHPLRSPSPYQDSLYRPPTISPHPHNPYQAHSPPPGPMSPDSYQLQDRPYGGQRPLEIPMGPGPHGRGTPSDQLAAQPTYSVENVNYSYGHNDAYGQAHPPQQEYEQPAHNGGYALDPQAHHDGYYNQPYQPSPGEEMQHYPMEHDNHYNDEADNRPILQADSAYGPNPARPSSPSHENYEEHEEHMQYMDAEGRPAPPPPPAPVRRWKTLKQVQLFQGNLVLDCPVPPRLLNQMDRDKTTERDEYTHMRYTAATCDPSEFYGKRFTLRQRLFAKPRNTELFIVITMYNEEDDLFARTLIGVIKNIEHMNSRTNSKTWGKDAWKKIVVCIVSDGRAQINPRTRAVLAGLGIYQDGIAKQQVNDVDVTAHIYEYTTQMTCEIKNSVVQIKKGSSPVQMLFCLKEKNSKKINSHRWFFQAFGSVLDPNICVLLDAGTKPGKDSIYLLWKKFERMPHCAGACGEIKAMLGKGLLNPLVAAQNFEYKISNILDKPLESVFGFISVLPGAFSAYRYIALQNDKTGQGPLEKYFKGETLHGDVNAGVFSSNMYLAEDRILCFELIAKRNCNWILQYVKGATGETDVPTEMDDFIKQRRRWLNGSFFAAVYALVHFYQVFRSGHSIFRKLLFMVEFGYQTFNMLFAWFAIGNFFLVFRILTGALSRPELLGTAGNILAVIFEWLYLVTLVSCFILSLGNTPQGSKRFYMTMVYFWVVLMVYLMFAAIFITVKSIQATIKPGVPFTVALIFSNQIFFTLMVSMVATYLLYFVMSILFLDPWHMFHSFVQYLLLTPTYINILNVYAFCNTHDVTWGTKGQEKPDKLASVNIKPDGKIDVHLPDNEQDLNSQYEIELRSFAAKPQKVKKVVSPSDKQENYYKGFRSGVVLIWIFCNLALTAVVLNTGGFQRLNNGQLAGSQTAAEKQITDEDIIDKNSRIYMQVVLWSVAGLSAFRWVGSFWFLVLRIMRGI